MVAKVLSIAAVGIATAVGEKICNVIGRPDIGEYVKVAGVGLTGGVAIGIAVSLIKQTAEAFAGY